MTQLLTAHREHGQNAKVNTQALFTTKEPTNEGSGNCLLHSLCSHTDTHACARARARAHARAQLAKAFDHV